MTNKKRWLGDKGFSLVEIMVAVAMVGGLALVVMTLKKDTATSTKRLEIASEIISLHNMIGQILLDETACTNTLRNFGVGGGGASVSIIRNAATPFPGGQMYRTYVNPGDPTYGNGTVRITSINAQLVGAKTTITSEADRARANVRLTITYNRISSLLTGNTTIARELMLSAKVVNSTDVVDTCYSNEGDAIQEAARIACEAIEGVFDAAAQKCDLKNYGVAPAGGDPSGNSMGISFQWIEGFRRIGTGVLGVLTIGDNSGDDAGTTGDLLTLTTRMTVNGVTNFQRNVNVSSNRSVNLNTGSVINFASDRKLKKNIVEIPDVLEKIDQISGVEFDWKDGNGHDVGFIAQEIQKVFPSLVSEQDGYNHLFVRYPQMSAVAIQGVKQLRQENILLRQENEKLNADLNKVQSEVEGISYYLCHELKQEKFCH